MGAAGFVGENVLVDAGCLVIRLDEAGQVDYFNELAHEKLGTDDPLGLDFLSELVAPESIDDFRLVLLKATDGEELEDVDVVLLGPDGRVVQLKVDVVPMMDSAGDLMNMVIRENVSPSEPVRMLLEVDEYGDVADCNQAGLDLLGYQSAEKLIGHEHS